MVIQTIVSQDLLVVPAGTNALALKFRQPLALKEDLLGLVTLSDLAELRKLISQINLGSGSSSVGGGTSSTIDMPEIMKRISLRA